MIDEFDLLAHPGEAPGWRDLHARLRDEFGAALGHQEIERCVLDAVATFVTAPIRTYLAILVERDARARLLTSVRHPVAEPMEIRHVPSAIREPVAVGTN